MSGSGLLKEPQSKLVEDHITSDGDGLAAGAVAIAG
jgi:hypothetical protein